MYFRVCAKPKGRPAGCASGRRLRCDPNGRAIAAAPCSHPLKPHNASPAQSPTGCSALAVSIRLSSVELRPLPTARTPLQAGGGICAMNSVEKPQSCLARVICVLPTLRPVVYGSAATIKTPAEISTGIGPLLARSSSCMIDNCSHAAQRGRNVEACRRSVK